MSEIKCYIPLKLRLRGELSEDDWVDLENKLVGLYVSAIQRSLKITSSSLPSSSLAPGSSSFREPSQHVPQPTELDLWPY